MHLNFFHCSQVFEPSRHDQGAGHVLQDMTFIQISFREH